MWLVVGHCNCDSDVVSVDDIAAMDTFGWFYSNTIIMHQSCALRFGTTRMGQGSRWFAIFKSKERIRCGATEEEQAECICPDCDCFIEISFATMLWMCVF
ncbi:uncharacterized protein [Atheta coriaria]|uniref:uncharacterized protein n=1 Tax=Dalotia coriaria TaxID=877792 RepID=UPI0031F4704C